MQADTHETQVFSHYRQRLLNTCLQSPNLFSNSFGFQHLFSPRQTCFVHFDTSLSTSTSPALLPWGISVSYLLLGHIYWWWLQHCCSATRFYLRHPFASKGRQLGSPPCARPPQNQCDQLSAVSTLFFGGCQTEGGSCGPPRRVGCKSWIT